MEVEVADGFIQNRQSWNVACKAFPYNKQQQKKTRYFPPSQWRGIIEEQLTDTHHN
jgi:hypothetical protein